MTTKLQAGLVFILLFVAISCTKENDNSLTSGSGSPEALTSSSADAAAAAKAAEARRFNFAGSWTLHWSWSCGPKSAVAIFFNRNGTLSDAFGETGVWTAGPHTILWKFDGREDHWSGHDVPGGTVDGIMADFSFDIGHGCLQLTRSALNSNEKLIKGTTAPGK